MEKFVEIIKSVRKIPNKEVYGENAGKYRTSYLLSLNGKQYDLNFFTDSGIWIRKMKFSKLGKILTIWIEKDWYKEQFKSTDIIELLYREYAFNGVIHLFPEEVRFKLVQ